MFNFGSRKFQYPDAFDSYLSFYNEDLQEQIIIEIETIKNDKAVERTIGAHKRATALIPTQSGKEAKSFSRATKSSHKFREKNTIFKYNFCDGGATDKQIGFNGVCSKDIIHYNIKVEKRAWCSHDDCDCVQYLNGKCSYEELEGIMFDCGHLCYESALLRDWTAYMGCDNDGEPRKLSSWVANNSLCVLTTLEPAAESKDRIIFAVYLIGEFQESDGIQAGMIKAHPKYRLKLSPIQARKIKLWNYYANKSQPNKPLWGTGLARKLDDEAAAYILKDIAELKQSEEDGVLAEEFFKHFCEINKLDSDNLPEPKGALRIGK